MLTGVVLVAAGAAGAALPPLAGVMSVGLALLPAAAVIAFCGVLVDAAPPSLESLPQPLLLTAAAKQASTRNRLLIHFIDIVRAPLVTFGHDSIMTNNLDEYDVLAVYQGWAPGGNRPLKRDAASALTPALLHEMQPAQRRDWLRDQRHGQ